MQLAERITHPNGSEPSRPFNWPSCAVREGSERNEEAGAGQAHGKGGEGKAQTKFDS